MKKHEVFQQLISLGLKEDEYAIFGSGIMFALGIRPLRDLDDIDIVVNENGWNKVKDLGDVKIAPDWGCEYMTLFEEQIEIYKCWGPGEYSIDELINTSIQVESFNFVNKENTIKWKLEMGREKDLKHIQMIRNFQ